MFSFRLTKERNYMKKWTVVALIGCWLSTSYAAQATITGQGEVLSYPDYVELSIVVDSKCYASPSDARKINDESARKIVDFLNGKVKNKDEYNTVISNGGYTSPYQTYYENKYLCQNTFQKQNTITFRTQDLENFEALFNEIQSFVYKELSRSAPRFIDSAISYATMSNPVPGVSRALNAKLEQQALGIAFADANAKLTALFGDHKVQNLKLTEASEIAPTEQPIYRQKFGTARAMMMDGGAMESAPAPVQFDKQEVSKTIYFKFTFDDIGL